MATYYGDWQTSGNYVKWRTNFSLTTTQTATAVTFSYALNLEYMATQDKTVYWNTGEFSYNVKSDSTSRKSGTYGNKTLIVTTTSNTDQVASGSFTIQRGTSSSTVGVSAALTWNSTSTASHDVLVPARDQYTVTFKNKDGSTFTTQTAYYGNTIGAPSTNPTARGYSFAGWYTDSALTTKASFPYTVTSNVTMYSAWSLTSKVYAKVNGSWVQIPKPMAKDSNGVWKECDVYVKVNGSWVKLN